MELKECKYCRNKLPIKQFLLIKKLGNAYSNGVWQGIDPACIDCRKERNRQKALRHYNNNKDNITSKKRELYKTEDFKNYNKKYAQKKRATDVNYKIKSNTSSRIRKLIKKSSSKTIDIIGCSIDELKKHLESKFTEGMGWENYGLKGWHIDHIKPCSSFDLTNEEEIRKCFHYSNLQPLWCEENWVKSDNL